MAQLTRYYRARSIVKKFTRIDGGVNTSNPSRIQKLY